MGIRWLNGLCVVLILMVLNNMHRTVEGAKVLLFPFNIGNIGVSRFFRMHDIGRILVESGHNTSMLVHTNYEKSPQRNINGLNRLYYKAPKLDETIENQLIQAAIVKNPIITKKMTQLLQRSYCEALISDLELMANIKNGKFDVIIVDYIDVCGRIILDYMDIPSMVFCSDGFEPEFGGLFAPNSLSFVPHMYTANTDDMNFLQRTWNFVAYLLAYHIMGPLVFEPMQELKNKYGLNDSLSIYESYEKADIIMVNSDFAIDYPRPLMPNIILVAGMLQERLKSLPKDLANFVEGSGQHGVIVVSFGTQVKEMDDARSEIIARVLAKFPQRVVWKNDGKTPVGLGNNTRLLTWLPQNDLLGHPKVRLFVSHCGSSSMRESVQHGVPVVAIPLFADQFQQAVKLVSRKGMGVLVDYNTLSAPALEDAIKEVLDKPIYTKRARTVSRIIQPERVQDTFLFWVEFLAENGQAEFLQSQVAKSLSWVRYFMVDVVGFLVALVLAILALVVYLFKCCYNSVCRGRKSVKLD